MKRPLPPTVSAVFVGAESTLFLLFLTLDLLGRASVAVKYAGILLCLAYVALAACRGGDRLLLPAMAFTAAADAFLLVAGEGFLLGVLLFLCVQTIYLLRLRRQGAPAALPLRAGLALLAGLVLYALRMATPLNLLAGLYFSQLVSNALLSWTVPDRRFSVGLSLFVGCDICVGLFNSGLFHGPLFRFVFLGMWIFYLPSQVLIALSALPKEVSHAENK